MIRLQGQRLVLRPLVSSDFPAYSEVRIRNDAWLRPWEPMRVPGQADPALDRDAFSVRCSARERERQLGAGYGFGLFVNTTFVGEINLNSIHRGAFQNSSIGYWVDQAHAGHGYMSEAVVVLAKFAFDELRLHRLQIDIIPRNARSRRVVEKLELREEGMAERYLEINGVWEDHLRFAITVEEWEKRRDELARDWL